ncbi:MAG TPA: septum formation initiator family protein [Bryobacteraceae bacterium]|nr:septum formation initiator family protein [Bryobacteraceae bacterium]
MLPLFFQASHRMKISARFAYLAAFLLVVGYAFFTLRGPRGIPALLEKQHEIEQMEKQNGELARDVERKREHIQRLTDNPAEQELEIRQRLKLVHPGEKVYILNETK